MTNSNTILVVERETLIMDVIVEVLSDEGYSMRTAANGLAALAAISFETPVLTLFDMALQE